MSGEKLNLGSDEKRKTLWIVLWLNVAIAVGFFATGLFGDSNALLANGLDNTSDAAVWKRGAARLSGIMLLVFSAGVIIDAIRRFLEGSEPVGVIMMIMAAIAGGVNLLCLRLLQKLQNKDVNLRAATTFSFNDFVSNGGILIAGVIVLWTGSNWPDLIVGIAVACIALYGGIEILRDAHMDKHDEDGSEHGRM